MLFAVRNIDTVHLLLFSLLVSHLITVCNIYVQYDACMRDALLEKKISADHETKIEKITTDTPSQAVFLFIRTVVQYPQHAK